MRTISQQRLKAITLVLIALSVCSFMMISNWKVKQPYEVRFAGGKISGKFELLKADIAFDKAHPEDGHFSATIPVESIATGFFIKNNHAKDALGADLYPTISFKSTKISKTANGYATTGDLTIKGVTKPATINFTFEDKGDEGIFKGNFKVIPKSFNIIRNGSPDELTITLTVPVTRQ